MWHNMLAIYRSYRSKVRQSMQTRSAYAEVYRPRWPAWEALSFMNDASEDAEHADTLDEEDEGLSLNSLVTTGSAVARSRILPDHSYIKYDPPCSLSPDPTNTFSTQSFSPSEPLQSQPTSNLYQPIRHPTPS
uniref:MADF domain-containing protein n=1 Tax=Anopheles gambiae TaxID=7165 RepID=A0A1S4HDD1_ANOGA